jgi:membrane protein required for colicin V production
MIRHFNVLDLVFGGIALVSLIAGIIRGLVSELFSLGFLILSVVLAIAFYPPAAVVWLKLVADKGLANFFGFLTIFLAVLILGSVMTGWLKKLVADSPLGPLDRLLGGVFGLIRALVLSWIIVFCFLELRAREDVLLHSRLSPYVMRSFRIFLNLVPENARKKIETLQYHDQQKNSRNRGTV